jgi:hypothetical protein
MGSALIQQAGTGKLTQDLNTSTADELAAHAMARI